MNICDKF